MRPLGPCTKLEYSARQDDTGMGVGRGATRVAIYTRVSTGEQTPELQLRELRDYAGRRKRRQPLRAISLRSGADAASLTRDVNPRRALNWRRHEPSGDFVNREVIADPPEGLVLANGRDTRARE